MKFSGNSVHFKLLVHLTRESPKRGRKNSFHVLVILLLNERKIKNFRLFSKIFIFRFFQEKFSSRKKKFFEKIYIKIDQEFSKDSKNHT